jgi:uncharacterized protein (TIGR03083 family)
VTTAVDVGTSATVGDRRCGGVACRDMNPHADRYGLVTDFDPVAAMERDALALADAAEKDLAAPVVSCPGWDAAELVRHVREVHHFWGAIVEGGLSSPDQVQRPDQRLDGAALLEDYRDGVRAFAEVLRRADPAAPVWTWASQQDVAFVVRHQVQEAAVHRWDAETAAGREFVIETPAAADAVEEFLTHSAPYRVKDAATVGGDVVLSTTDAGLAWLVGEDAEGTARWRRLAPDEEPLGAVAVARGTASDLLLLLFRRRSAADLEVDGDRGAVDRLTLRSGTD